MKTALPPLVATDLEGIFLPEIWIAVAEATGIDQLRLTTRDITDYDELMRMRLAVLRTRGVTVDDIQAVIAAMDVLPGATEFLAWLREQAPLIIITDSFYQLISPFYPALGYATIFAHSLLVDEDRFIQDYVLRVANGKRKSLAAFHHLGFRTMAIGDSYNDIGMLEEADKGVLYRPPLNVSTDYPMFAVARDYTELQEQVLDFLATDVQMARRVAQ